MYLPTGSYGNGSSALFALFQYVGSSLAERNLAFAMAKYNTVLKTSHCSLWALAQEELLNSYGMVVMDECHHAASDTPRYTRVVDTNESKNDINGAFFLISTSRVRNEMILTDTRACVKDGRTPVILTKYKEHAKYLYDHLKDDAEYVFLLYGDNTDKENAEIRIGSSDLLPKTMVFDIPGSIKQSHQKVCVNSDQ